MSNKHGRHTPAFLLLFLADTPAYGALLLTRMQTELPYCSSDSAIVYRSLQEMEKDGLVEASWETPETGQPRKWYVITAKGMLALKEFELGIRKRHTNFEYFLSHYTTIIQGKENKHQSSNSPNS